MPQNPGRVLTLWLGCSGYAVFSVYGDTYQFARGHKSVSQRDSVVTAAFDPYVNMRSRVRILHLRKHGIAEGFGCLVLHTLIGISNISILMKLWIRTERLELVLTDIL